jgi:peptidylprolyl isomerase
MINEAIKKQFGDEDITVISARHTGEIKVADLVKGAAAPIYCGSKVTTDYKAFLQSYAVFDDTYKRNSPITFTTGKSQVIKGLSQGLVGMQIGGKRKIIIPPQLAFDDNNFEHSAVTKGQVVIYEVEPRKVTPLFKDAQPEYTYRDLIQGKEKGQAFCGNKVRLQYQVYYANKLLEGSEEAITVTTTLGEHRLPFALEQGVIGMQKGGRRLILASGTEANKILAKKSDFSKDITLPKEGLVTFNVMLLETE